MEYVPSDRKGLFPVGRLDKDTEGLLLITDDGMLAHELLAPGKHVDKTYFVRVEGKLTVEKIEKLEKGVDIGEKKLTMPAKVEIVGGSWEGAGEPEPGLSLIHIFRFLRQQQLQYRYLQKFRKKRWKQ